VIRAVKAERGFVIVVDDDSSLIFQSARIIDHQTIDDPENGTLP